MAVRRMRVMENSLSFTSLMSFFGQKNSLIFLNLCNSKFAHVYVKPYPDHALPGGRDVAVVAAGEQEDGILHRSGKIAHGV